MLHLLVLSQTQLGSSHGRQVVDITVFVAGVFAEQLNHPGRHIIPDMDCGEHTSLGMQGRSAPPQFGIINNIVMN
ncbi:hypothetical protein D3C75_970360 [compost metagenome]